MKIYVLTLCFAVCGCSSGVTVTPAHSTPAMHPMDPLTASECQAIQAILKQAGHVDDFSLYPLVTLDEPEKSAMLDWTAGQPFARRAFVIVKKKRQIYEAIVDIGNDRVVDWRAVAQVQPGILPTEEWDFIQRLVRSHSGWREAVRKRGIEDLRTVVCMPHSIGYYAIPEETGRRLFKVSCYQRSGSASFWGRPLEGLIAVVDLDQGKLLRLDDSGVVPLPAASTDQTIRSESSPPAILEVPASKPGFKIVGHIVHWRGWRFHVRIDPRVGPVISRVFYQNQGKMRSILYSASLSELFIPYMDPDPAWYFKTYMDAGEYGLGKLVAPLQPSLDCPLQAVFFPALFADDWGESYTVERAACLFERATEDVAWRHYDTESGASQVRRDTELVFRFISTIGNYDYLFDWIFRGNATLRVAVGATGTEQVKAVHSRHLGENANDFAYGHMVAPQRIAVNHDHFFSFRLDLDIDGPQNSFVQDRLVTQRLPADSPRKSIWVVKTQQTRLEQDAKLRIDSDTLWRVINPHVSGPLGYPVGYRLQPGSNTVSLMSADDFPQKRAAFTNYHLWVTPYHPDERYAAGAYPNQHPGGDGLPRWTRLNRSISDTDIVLWYTLGFHHVVRSEDWPMLSTHWVGFELQPFDFFQHNPTLDPPPYTNTDR